MQDILQLCISLLYVLTLLQLIVNSVRFASNYLVVSYDLHVSIVSKPLICAHCLVVESFVIIVSDKDLTP